MLRKQLDKILIWVGCLMLAVALWLHFDAKVQQERLVADYNLLMGNLADGEGESATASDSGDGSDVIGILSIPKIDLIVAVQEGVEQHILNYALGHFPQTALPGEKGNFAIIGHRNYARGQFFNRLGELEVGDEVVVRYGPQEYVYRVTQTFVVTPDQTSVLDSTPEAQITLITCAPARRSTHRLIVKGMLVEQPDTDSPE